MPELYCHGRRRLERGGPEHAYPFHASQRARSTWLSRATRTRKRHEGPPSFDESSRCFHLTILRWWRGSAVEELVQGKLWPAVLRNAGQLQVAHKHPTGLVSGALEIADWPAAAVSCLPRFFCGSCHNLSPPHHNPVITPISIQFHTRTRTVSHASCHFLHLVGSPLSHLHVRYNTYDITSFVLTTVTLTVMSTLAPLFASSCNI